MGESGQTLDWKAESKLFTSAMAIQWSQVSANFPVPQLSGLEKSDIDISLKEFEGTGWTEMATVLVTLSLILWFNTSLVNRYI